MELHEALSQITAIRRQMAKSELYRGYRSAAIACTGLFAVLAAGFQSRLVPSPETHLDRYLFLWIGVAIASALAAGAEMCWRLRIQDSAIGRQLTMLAVAQLSPSLAMGALLTLCIYRSAPETAWMLPGLWAMIFSLGIFASYRLLPRPFFLVAVYYGVCGIGCILFCKGAYAFSPWQMGISFGGGQLISAAILYWTLERNHATQE